MPSIKAILDPSSRSIIEKHLNIEKDFYDVIKSSPQDFIGSMINLDLPFIIEKLSKRTLRIPRMSWKFNDYSFLVKRPIEFGALVFGFQVLVNKDNITLNPTAIKCVTSEIFFKRKLLGGYKADLEVIHDRVTCTYTTDYDDIRWFIAAGILLSRQEYKSILKEISSKCGKPLNW